MGGTPLLNSNVLGYWRESPSVDACLLLEVSRMPSPGAQGGGGVSVRRWLAGMGLPSFPSLTSQQWTRVSAEGVAHKSL